LNVVAISLDNSYVVRYFVDSLKVVLIARQGNECAGLRSGTEPILGDTVKPADVRSN
jgi:hypothetical protein